MQPAHKTPTPVPRAAQRKLPPAAEDEIEYSTSEDEDDSNSSTATSSSTENESTDTESSAGEDSQPDEAAAPPDAEASDMVDGQARTEDLPGSPMDEDVDLARKRKALNEPPDAKVPRLDAESAEQSDSSESNSSESSQLSESAESGEALPDPQTNNSSCAEPQVAVEPVTNVEPKIDVDAEVKAEVEVDVEAEAPPAIEEPLSLEKASAGSYQFAPAGPLDQWRGGSGAVQAVASSRARITNSRGEQFSLDSSSAEADADNSEDAEGSGSSGSEAFVTTEASGANPSAAIARATARAASIAGAALARGRNRQGAEEYRIFISTSCTVRPSPVLEASRLQITVSSDSELQQRRQPPDPSAEAEKKRVVSSPRRLDSRDGSENVFSLLRMGRQDTTQETVTQELPSPAKGDKADYADFEAATRSVIKSRYNTERREDIADDYCRRATKAVQAEVQLMEQLKTDESAESTDRLGRIRSDQERFLELKRQLDALKARQLARQRQMEAPRQTAVPPRSPIVPAAANSLEQLPVSPQSGDTTLMGGQMVESAYISDNSDPSSPTSANKASPEEPQRRPYRSVLQEAALLPGGARPPPRHHQSSLQLDQERLQRARNEYFRRPIFDPATRPSQSGSLLSGGSNSPSDYRARSASSTLSKDSSRSMYQLRELLDDQGALQVYSRLSSSGRRRYVSTDIDDLPDGGVVEGASAAGSRYDLNAFDTEPGNYKSVSLFDLRRNMLANDVRAAAAATGPAGNANDSKSYVSLIETDIDTGEEVSQEIVMETDVDAESPLSPAPKSQSLLDLAMLHPTPGGVLDRLGARDAELDQRLNRANSEDLLDSGAAPMTARRVKASRTNSKRRQQQQEKTFIQRLEERATSESEKAICKSLSRLDIPKWMDNLKLSQDSAAETAASASAAEASRPWSTRNSLGAGRQSAAPTDATDQSLQPLIIPKFISLPIRPALFSPGYSSLSSRREELNERGFEKTFVSSERSRPPPSAAVLEEPRRKYFTESSIRRDSLPADSRSLQKQPPPKASTSVRQSGTPSLVLAPLKLDPADFLPKSEMEVTAAAEPPVEMSVAPLKAAVAESALPPPPPRLSTLPPESLDGSSDESRDDNRQASDASTMMFIDRSFRETSEQQQQLGDTSTTVSTDFPSDTQSESGSALAEQQVNDNDEDKNSSGSSEDSSEDSSTTGSSSSESSGTPGSQETSEADESGDEDEVAKEQQQQQQQPVPKPRPQPEQKQPPQHQLTNGSVLHRSSGLEVGPENKPVSSIDRRLKQQRQSVTSSSEDSSTGSRESGSSSEDESAESEEETVIETSVIQPKLLRPDARLLAHQPEVTATVSYADGLSRQSQTADALAFVDRQLAAARSSGLSEPLAAAAAAVPATPAPRDGRRSPPVSLADEALVTPAQRRGVIRDAGRYLVECVNPRCAKRVELPEAEGSFVSCRSCYTYYCSAECRRGHWDAHKRNCAYVRAANECRQVASRLLQDSAAHCGISSLARAGQRRLGRGCVLLLLSGAGNRSAPLRPPVFAPMGDLPACGLVGEQLREVTEACRSFDPSGALVLCAGVSVDSGSGPLVTSWSFLRLASEKPLNDEGLAAAAEAAAAEATQRREQQLKQCRAELLDKVRRELQQRGVSLRHHYPRLMAVLQEFVDTGREFPPQTVRPVDTTCGRTFEYCVQPGADPVTRWVESPQPAVRRQRPQAPPRRSVVSTDL